MSGHYRLTDKNSLVISNPSRYDAANYTCVARTALDSVEKSIEIHVDGMFIRLYSSPYVQKRRRRFKFRSCFLSLAIKELSDYGH